MRIAVTGSNGSVGRRVVACALGRGHEVVGIDTAESPVAEEAQDAAFNYVQADLRDYDATAQSLRGCDGVVHLAACRTPGDYVVNTHNTNVVISWNVLRAAAELGIMRIAQASSVNVIPMVYSVSPKIRYFPIDEDHPCEPDEPYGLSKVICELQADTIVRRHPDVRIASLRIHWSIPDREKVLRDDPAIARNDLWGYVHEDSAADAFLRALTLEEGKWAGHERFFIAAPDIRFNGDTAELHKQFWGDVPLKEGTDLRGRKGFFNCSKAQRLLGWSHKNPGD